MNQTTLNLEYRQIEALIPYANNSRTHSDTQVAQIAASIREFGWTNPVLIDGENGIIAGHGRVLAARKLGKTHQNILVFVKGDPKKATQACGEVEVSELDVAEAEN
ncbi:hypothetical protein GCM10009007_03210 [Formosimonas limnophila]|uniref:ParB-like N-terminal domain-containing protein n=1 Tax=Formosimonas limnophila TaxID=1384487 RepID=A0A8J3CJR2_9BURK|nr:ParB/Srx family N-terminal domain-containing protein [Formosimonas limnophila]GHA66117.1 hypothetical protein GCM10009007_03210 [Formosimonas limnophila]